MEFDRVVRYVAIRSREELVKVRDALKDNAQARQELEVVLADHAKLGDKSLLGWDYSRYITLCRRRAGTAPEAANAVTTAERSGRAIVAVTFRPLRPAC
jgi:hypothetical protein